jgi:hypothetical protein
MNTNLKATLITAAIAAVGAGGAALLGADWTTACATGAAAIVAAVIKHFLHWQTDNTATDTPVA